MDNQTALHPTGSKHVYHLGYSRLTYPAILLAVALALGLGLSKPFDPTVALICAGVFAGILGILALMLRFGIRLVITDESIAYYNIGFRVISPWENVASLARVTANGWTTESLLLRQDGLQTSGWFRVGLAILPAANAINILSGHGYAARSLDMNAYSHVIPVGYFPDWKSGILRVEIQRHAPQAFSRDRV
jgi:hypothetical protein